MRLHLHGRSLSTCDEEHYQIASACLVKSCQGDGHIEQWVSQEAARRAPEHQESIKVVGRIDRKLKHGYGSTFHTSEMVISGSPVRLV